MENLFHSLVHRAHSTVQQWCCVDFYFIFFIFRTQGQNRCVAENENAVICSFLLLFASRWIVWMHFILRFFQNEHTERKKFK